MSPIHFWCPHCHQLHDATAYWQVAGVAVCRVTHQAMTLGAATNCDELALFRHAQVIVQMRQASCAHYWYRIIGPGRTERCARCLLVRYQPEVYRRSLAYRIHPVAGFDGVWVDEDGSAWLGMVRHGWVEVAMDDEAEWIAAPAEWRERVIAEFRP